MHNISHKIDGDNLVITIDISARSLSAAPDSSTGKTKLVGTTGGTVAFKNKAGADLSFAVNVMAKKS